MPRITNPRVFPVPDTPIKLEPQEGSATEVTVGRLTILFSYQTPVAYLLRSERDRIPVVVEDGHRYSTTTKRHIAAFRASYGAEIDTEPHEDFVRNLTTAMLNAMLGEAGKATLRRHGDTTPYADEPDANQGKPIYDDDDKTQVGIDQSTP